MSTALALLDISEIEQTLPSTITSS